MRVSRLILAILVLSAALSAATEWTAASSDHFELLTTGGTGKARSAIQHFEEIHDFFVKAVGINPKLKQKVRLVAFNSPKEWQRFRPNEGTAAYYQSGLDRDTIAMGSLSQDVYAVAAHEYVHLLLKHSGGTYPVWLNEGLAELYSSMNAVGGKMRVGDLHLGRLQLLQSSKWLPMEHLLAVDHASPIYTQKSHQGIFYSQSWALAHMLALGDAYRPKANDFLRLVAVKEVPAAQAFQEVYGKTIFQVQKDLEEYSSSNRFKILVFDYKPEKPLKPEVRPASAYESDLAVARLLSHAEDPRDAEEIFGRLEQQDAANIELGEAYGFHLMYRRKPEEAARRLGQAIASGSTNPKVHSQYAFLVQTTAPQDAVKAMQKAVELDPADRELGYFLGRMLLTSKRYAEAVSALAAAKPVPAEHVVGYLEAHAYIYLAYKKTDQARIAAERAVQMAKSDDERRRAAAVMQLVDQWESNEARRKEAEERFRKYQEDRAAAAAAGASAPAGEPRVDVPAGARAEFTPETPVQVPTVKGKLRRVDCQGQRATLTVFAEGKLQRFTIEDPASVVITGTGTNGATAEFSCGPQNDVSVVVGHASGVVRTLGFQ